jgi:hypothetical protein
MPYISSNIRPAKSIDEYDRGAMSTPHPGMFDTVCTAVWSGFRLLFGGSSAPAAPAARPETLVKLDDLEPLRAKYNGASEFYGARYRFGFVANFSLGFLAVAFAALPLALDESFVHHDGWMLTLIEGICIVSILSIHMMGREGKHGPLSRLFETLGISTNNAWRRRWVENRIHAEQFRYADLLVAFPGGPILLNENAAAFLDERLNHAYADWHASTCAKLSAAGHGSDYVERYRRVALHRVEEQIDYHRANAHRCETIHHRLHRLANACFWATLAVCIAHFFTHSGLLSMLAVSLPAAAAACHGIIGAGEFATFAQQSEEMVVALEATRAKLLALGLSDIDGLNQVIRSFYRLVVSEASGWHVALRSKDLQVG